MTVALLPRILPVGTVILSIFLMTRTAVYLCCHHALSKWGIFRLGRKFESSPFHHSNLQTQYTARKSSGRHRIRVLELYESAVVDLALRYSYMEIS